MSATETYPQHHGQMWFEDGNLVLQAEQTTFKVHRSIVARQSEFFKDMLSLPKGNDVIEEGTEAHPLFVPDTSAAAFAGLLSFIYDVLWTELDLSDDTLIDVLRAAQRLQFAAVLKAVVSVLDKRLNARQKLKLGMARDIQAWQLPAFQEVVCGSTLFSVEPQPDLEDRMWVLVYQARESVRVGQVDMICDLPSGTVCQHKVFAVLCSLASATPPDVFLIAAEYLRTLRPPSCCSGGFTESDIELLSMSKKRERELVAKIWEKHLKGRM